MTEIDNLTDTNQADWLKRPCLINTDVRLELSPVFIQKLNKAGEVQQYRLV